MRQNIVYVIFIIMITSEKMFVLLGAFVFGYCVGYCSFEILKYKNQKEEILFKNLKIIKVWLTM